MTEKLMGRPIPTLAQWLGDGERADDFEAYVRTLLAVEYAVADENERASVRMIRTLTIACMEIARSETDTHGRDFTDTVRLLARSCGVAIMGPVLSAVREQPRVKLHKLADVIAEEFRHGAGVMARAQHRRAHGG